MGGVPFIEKQITAMPAEMDKLKADIQKESDPAKKKNLESSLQQAESYPAGAQVDEARAADEDGATTTTLKENGREIQLHVLGRAHTNGDLFIYLPKEKVVATGDALIDWMPFMNDGYPEDWINTLTALEKLEFTSIVPGHGEVRPKSQLAFFRGYFVDLIAAVKKARPTRPPWPRCRPRSAINWRRSTKPGCPSIRSDGIVTASGKTSR